MIPPKARVWLRFGFYLKIRGLIYSGQKFHCLCCKGNFRQFLAKKDGFEIRENVICPRCGVVERHRMLMLFLENETDFYKKNHTILHISPEYSTYRIFKQKHEERYIAADLNSAIADEHFDIQNIPYQDNSFSVILCSHVLAFVEDDIKALKELTRVLKSNGYLLLQTDLHDQQETSIHSEMETSAMTTYSQWERLRSYGEDFFVKLKTAGLAYKNIQFGSKIGDEDLVKFGLNPSESIIFCRKQL